MKIAVLVNNYNYGNFVGECIESLSSQNRLPDQVVLVDDGSTDNSMDVFNSFVSRNGNLNIAIVSKENGGQLSAFNAGFNKLDPDIDLVCFLDSDDKYCREYLQNLEQTALEHTTAQVFFSSYTFLYSNGDTKAVTFSSKELPPHFLQTVFANRFNGVPTSMISFRRSALCEILPHCNEKLWRVRADDVLVYLSSAKLMTRRYIEKPLVYYRIHKANQFHGKKPNANAEVRRLFALGKLMQSYRDSFYSLTYAEMRKIISFEFGLEKLSLKTSFRFIHIVFNLKIPFLKIPAFCYAFVKASLAGRGN